MVKDQAMGSDNKTNIRVRARMLIGRWLSAVIVVAAVSLGLVVLHRTNHYPRTDDAEVLANFIGIAPQVEGRIIRLHVRDNQFVKQGELLFEIDEQPYQYALEKAISDQSTLEGQIEDERRRIASQVSAVSVAKANIQGAESEVARYDAAIDQARADVTNAEQGVSKAKAEWEYANNNLHRLEPLLTKQFVTVDQVDQAKAGVDQSKAQHEQAQHAITTLGPVVNQRGAKKSAVENARYNLNNCRVYAPFDARVTNLTISEGAYAHVGQQVFTLIDARTWWAVANFREGQLEQITPGMRADVYVMSKPNVRFSGVVDSVGFGVTPSEDVVGRLQEGLPDVQRTLNWVHLASRYPVRVRVQDPPPDLFRVGQSAVVIIRSH